MAASEVEICNSALIKIGQTRITGFADDSKSARLCSEQYPKLRDELLASHPWNFALARVALGPLAAAPIQVNDGYLYQFQLPTDCLRVIQTDLPGITDAWKIEGRLLLAETDEIKILYLRRVTEVGEFPPTFAEVLAWKIARDIGYAISQTMSVTQMADSGYRSALADARTFDAQEGSIDQVEASEWFNARF